MLTIFNPVGVWSSLEIAFNNYKMKVSDDRTHNREAANDETHNANAMMHSAAVTDQF